MSENNWREHGLCHGIDEEFLDKEDNIFFERYESDSTVAKNVDEMCFRCPVQQWCGRIGYDGSEGVHGGVYWSGKKKTPDRSRNKHKTPEQKKQIERDFNVKF